MHRSYLMGLLAGLVCLLSASENAAAGAFSVSLGYGVKRIDGTSTGSDGDFDITAPAVSSIEVVGAG